MSYLGSNFATPQEAYDWARQQFSAGGFHFQGLSNRHRTFYLMTSGNFCMLTLHKTRVPR